MPWALQSERYMFEFHSFIYWFNKYLLRAYYVSDSAPGIGIQEWEGESRSDHLLIGELATTMQGTRSRITQPYAKPVVKVLPPSCKNLLLSTALWGQAPALDTPCQLASWKGRPIGTVAGDCKDGARAFPSLCSSGSLSINTPVLVFLTAAVVSSLVGTLRTRLWVRSQNSRSSWVVSLLRGLSPGSVGLFLWVSGLWGFRSLPWCCCSAVLCRSSVWHLLPIQTSSIWETNPLE